MNKSAVINLLLIGFLMAPCLVHGQASLPWITSINYQQSKVGDATTMDIHIALLQAGVPGFPCAAGASLTVDQLALTNADVKASQGIPNIAEQDKTPIQETGGYVYHLRVGTNLALPTAWESFPLSVTAHCAATSLVQQSPAIIVRKFATNNPLQVSIAGGQPQWNRSGNQDTLSFVIRSNWPVSIQSLVIKDNGNDPSTNGNIVTQAWPNDQVEATSHAITVKTLLPLQSREYKYEVVFTAGGLAVTPAQPLPPINLPAQPTKEYALVQFPTSDQLTIRDTSKDFSFQAQGNDSGTLDAIFDVPLADGSSTVHSTGNGITHIFAIAKNNIPADGQYSFHFEGTRSSPATSLIGAHPSILVVATKAALTGPIGLGLSADSASIAVTYCLSKTISTKVLITNNPKQFSVEGPGNPVTDGTAGCAAGLFPFKATIPLSTFSKQVPGPSAGSLGATQPANAASASVANSPPKLPIQLYIVDTSSTDRTLATLNLAAVLLSSQSPTGLVNAVKTLSAKGSTPDQKTAATTTLTKEYGLDQPTINTLIQINKKNGGAADTIGTILGTLGKSFVTAYLGIPAAK